MDAEERDDPDGLSERLRQALEPSPEAVERVVQRALLAPPAPVGSGPVWPRSAPSGARSDRRLLLAAAGAAVAFAAALLVAPRPAAPPEPAAISITNVGDIVVATSPDGGGWLVRSEAPDRKRPAGTMIIISGGGE